MGKLNDIDVFEMLWTRSGNPSVFGIGVVLLAVAAIFAVVWFVLASLPDPNPCHEVAGRPGDRLWCHHEATLRVQGGIPTCVCSRDGEE